MADTFDRLNEIELDDWQDYVIVLGFLILTWGVAIALHQYVSVVLGWVAFGTAVVATMGVMAVQKNYSRPQAWLFPVLLVVGFWFSPLWHGAPEVVPGPGPTPDEERVVAFWKKARRQAALILALEGRKSAVGSGIVVQKEGRTCFVLTAKHVLEGYNRSRLPVLVLYEDFRGSLEEVNERMIEVEKRDRYSPIVYEHPDQDWAILIMRDLSKVATPAKLSDEAPKKGAWVFAVGNVGAGKLFFKSGTLKGLVSKNGLTRLLFTAGSEKGAGGGPLYDNVFRLIGMHVETLEKGDEKKGKDIALSTQEVLKSIRMGAMQVPAKSDNWVDMRIKVEKGETIYASARGIWTVDWTVAGSWTCGAGGLIDEGEEYKKERLFKDYPLGSLVLGIEDPETKKILVLGTFDDAPTPTNVKGIEGLRTSRFKVTKAGRIVARINDNHMGQNDGTIDLAVVISK